MAQPVTVPAVRARKGGQPLVMVTAYDAPGARIADEAEVDIILVGDSVAMVVLGYDDTLQVTTDDMAHHVAAVARARPAALVVADLPWLSYHVSPADTVTNAAALVRTTTSVPSGASTSCPRRGTPRARAQPSTRSSCGAFRAEPNTRTSPSTRPRPGRPERAYGGTVVDDPEAGREVVVVVGGEARVVVVARGTRSGAVVGVRDVAVPRAVDCGPTAVAGGAPGPSVYGTRAPRIRPGNVVGGAGKSSLSRPRVAPPMN